ncbi:MAG: TIGR01212 family radical SAM protein, partial [Muribaculaceae bacterium]|nr:TIGR01212 family radical SAM protein [Muribaculaceae bacterium]
MVSRFTPYGEYLREKFGCKVQKLSVNAGFTCPNRDGSIGRGGCIYCDNRSFVPSYCDAGDSVAEQIAKG